jgi:hypothetical protein
MRLFLHRESQHFRATGFSFKIAISPAIENIVLQID